MRRSLLAVAVAALTLLSACQSGVSAQDVCTSTFHINKFEAVVTNPPLQPVNIVVLPATAKHYQIECLFLTQDFPLTVNRACASPPNQRLQLCHTPVTGVGAGMWTCIDISQYLTTQFSTVFVGSSKGPELRLRITWMSQLTNIECYPRTFKVLMVGLDVPEPGTNLGASIAFIVLVAIVAVGALSYGAYSLWRVSKRFEHRDGNAASPTSPNGPQEAYRAALKALGAPPGIDSLYDEDGGGGGGGGVNDSAAQQLNYGEEFDEEEQPTHDDDDDADDGHAHQQHSRHQHRPTAKPATAVLDNDQIVESTAQPTPWYARIEQQSIERTRPRHGGAGSRRGGAMQPARGGSTGLVHSGEDDDDFDADEFDAVDGEAYRRDARTAPPPEMRAPPRR